MFYLQSILTFSVASLYSIILSSPKGIKSQGQSDSSEAVSGKGEIWAYYLWIINLGGLYYMNTPYSKGRAYRFVTWIVMLNLSC